MGNSSNKGHSSTERITGLAQLLEARVANVLQVDKRTLLYVRPTDTLKDCLHIFSEHHILSAPVIQTDGSCIGFISMDDVLIALYNVCKTAVKDDHAGESTNVRSDELKHSLARNYKFLSKPVEDILHQHRTHANVLSVKADAPLAEALLVFAIGAQRLAVSNKKGQIYAILSQSTLLKFLAQDFGRLGDEANHPASDLGTPWKKLPKCWTTVSTIDALEVMHEKGVHLLSLVDKDGGLVGCLSMSDFKTLHEKEDSLASLTESVMTFIHNVRSSHGQPDKYIVSCPDTANLKDVIQTMVEKKVHQVYLVNSDGKPVSLVSMTHVCHKIFYKHKTAAAASARTHSI